MDFALLQSRLVAHLRARVRNGELTERGVARLTGISQPHVHNVLKGTRLLSPDSADRLLRHLRINLLDLLEARERSVPPGLADEIRWVPVADGWLGPGHPLPDLDRARSEHPVEACACADLDRPVLVRLAADPDMAPLFVPGDLALLDRSEPRRQTPEGAACYAVCLGREGRIRRLRRNREGLALLPINAAEPFAWGYISLMDHHILEVVKAKVILIGRNLEPPRIAPRQTEETGAEHRSPRR